MDRGQQRRIAQRELGRRRVGRATQAVAVAGTALAAVFGVAFAKSPAAVPNGAVPTVAPPAGYGDGDTGGQFSSPVSPAPDLQPPAEAPQPYFGDSGGASSSPT